jgi:TubC N-terminal docking domain
MDSKTILNHCFSIGVTLYTQGGKLLARPAQCLTDELRAAIKSHKSELLELLTPKQKRAIVRFKLLNGQGGVVIGSDTDTPESLIDDLHTKYGNRLATTGI